MLLLASVRWHSRWRRLLLLLRPERTREVPLVRLVRCAKVASGHQRRLLVEGAVFGRLVVVVIWSLVLHRNLRRRVGLDSVVQVGGVVLLLLLLIAGEPVVVAHRLTRTGSPLHLRREPVRLLVDLVRLRVLLLVHSVAVVV